MDAALGSHVGATWTIDRVVPGGDGFVRLPDGRVGFAAGTAPGDRIRVIELDDRRSYVRAVRWELEQGGPGRTEPSCPYAGVCGGCDFMHLDRTTELEQKASMLREALGRTGGFRELPSIQVQAVGPELGYRQRLRLQVDGAGRLGLFERKSHELVAIERCQVSDEGINTLLGHLREVAARYPTALAAVSTVELRVAAREPRALAHFNLKEGGTLPQALVAELSLYCAVSVRGGPQVEQRYPLPLGQTLIAPAEAFTQVNWAVNEALVDAVVDGARQRQARSFCDLYCGAGNFSLPLLAAGLSGVGVDRGVGIAAARWALAESGLSGGTFRAGPVERVLAELLGTGEHFDLVIADPPREGAARVLLDVAALRPRYIALVSCDPVTFARDSKQLCRRGFRLDQVLAFDMFPRTHHFEVLGWLVRSV
jgi:23S rRNA (uracil1939-C5)-methyltransferase